MIAAGCFDRIFAVFPINHRKDGLFAVITPLAAFTILCYTDILEG